MALDSIPNGKSGTIRFPIAVPVTDRELSQAGNYTTDTYLTNCFVQKEEDGRVMVVKRPGLLSAYTYGPGGTVYGQGAVFYKGFLWAMGSNILYRPTGGALNGNASGTAWTASTAASWLGRRNFGAIAFQGKLFVMGGENSGGAAFLNDVWSTTDCVNWSQVVSAAPWTKRRSMGLAVLGDTLYLIGGDGAAIYNDVWSTPDGVNWTQVQSAMPMTARLGFGVAALNNGIFLAGGITAAGAEQQDVWFTPDGVVWTQMVAPAGFSPRYYFSMLAYQNKLWIFGGISLGVVLSNVYSSPDGITWTNTGTLPAARELMAATVYGNTMWFVGGLNAAIANTTTVWSTQDGATFTVVTAAYGGNALNGAALVPFATPTSVSTINAATMWLIGGLDTVGYTNNIYRADLNGSLGSTYAPATTAAVTDQWQFATQNAGLYLIAKTTSDAWVLWAGVMQKITSTNYPKKTVPGVAVLDDTAYVMDLDGVINGSNLSTPFIWSANNFITADYVADTGRWIGRCKNYVLALKSTSLQLFYNAGRYPGSPLLPSQQYNAKVGCTSAIFVVEMLDSIVWMAVNEQASPFIAVMDGGVPVKISTPAIDRILQSWLPSTTDHATSIRWMGHDVYLITLGGRNITLAYDFTMKLWYFVKSGTASAFRGINHVTDGQLDYLQDATLGILYSVYMNVYQDNTADITCVIQTGRVDLGNNWKKHTTGLTIIGDRRGTAPNNLLIELSDDDAQTFVGGWSRDLTTDSPMVTRTGSFRRRCYRLTHTSNNPLRLEALESRLSS